MVVRADEAATGCWDRMRLDQIVTNLVSNAIKYGEGKPIAVTTAVRADRVVLTVEDHGGGIPQELQRQIFEPFVRAARAHAAGGLGLGLHIVRDLTRRMGGDVWVDSAPGQGATFTVELPLDGRPRE
jgi:signal transduction histidine kinase